MNPMQIFSMFNQVVTQFKQNPLSILAQKFNLPQNPNNPQDIINHLLNSNQINQQTLNQATQLRDMFINKPN